MTISIRQICSLFAAFSACWIAVACGPETATRPAPSSEQTDRRSETENETTGGRLSEPRQHWFATGDDGRGEFVDVEGTPEGVAGRLVNKGTGIDFGSAGDQEWLVGSREGRVQLLDDDGTRKGSSRATFEGDGEMHFAVRGGDNWLVGGTAGQAQLLTRFGEPGQHTASPFGGDPVTAGVYLPDASDGAQWLVGSANGEFRHLGAEELEPNSSRIAHDASESITELVHTSSGWYGFTAGEMVEVTSNQVEASTSIADGRSITTVEAADGTILVGAEDGHVLAGSVSELGGADWQQALDGVAVRGFAWNGSEWLVVGDEGQVRKLAADGTPEGSVVQVANGYDLGAAHAGSEGWIVGLADLSVVHRLGPDLEAPNTPRDLLDGASVADMAAGAGGYLAVGDDGSVRPLDAEGEPTAELTRLEAVEAFTSVAWNGEAFLAGADDGTLVSIGPDGEVLEEASEALGAEVATLQWNGEIWMAGLADGTLQRVRSDGMTFRAEIDSGLESVRASTFNGTEWFVVGAYGEQEAGYAIVAGEEFELVDDQPAGIAEIEGEFRAAGWNGREWLAGGTGGTLARIEYSGGLIEGIVEVLHGRTIRALAFNGTDYLVGGDGGLIRRLQFDAEPRDQAIAVNEFRTVRALEWGSPKGFPGGKCFDSDICLSGACIDGESGSLCCDSDCEGPCRSCLGSVTGGRDGVCEPIEEGGEPPSGTAGCSEQAPESCGTTGRCDGEGECAVYGTDVECREASCSGGEVTSAGQCDGAQSCSSPETTSCEPYACAADAPECRETCESDEHCLEGYLCREGSCVDEDDASSDNDEQEEDSGGSTSEGGCAAGGGEAPSAPLQVVLGLLAGAAWLRRGTDSPSRGADGAS